MFPPIISEMANTGKNGGAKELLLGDEAPSRNKNVRVVEQTIDLTPEQLREFLRDLQRQKGYIADLAHELGVTPQFLGYCLSGQRNPGKKLLSKLGITYTKVYHVPVIQEVESD
jgi:hypothetical protein